MKKRTWSLLVYLGALVLSACEGSVSLSSTPSSSESESSSSSTSSSSSSTPISSSSSSSSSEESAMLTLTVKNTYPFASDNEDISSKIVASPESYFDCSGVTIFSATASKIFANASNDALRFASSKGAASLSLRLTSNVIISRILLDVSAYSTTDVSVTVGEGFTTGTQTVTSSTTEVSYDFAGVLANNTVTISSDVANRFFLYGITLVTASGSSSSSSSESSSSQDTGAGYYKASSFTTSYNDLKEEVGYVNLASTGTQKLLVIPVNFTDYGCDNLARGCATTRSDIETTFFGSASSTGWHSVSSYYSASSYGHLTLTGTVTPWFTVDKSRTQLNTLSGYSDPTYYVLRKAVEWYKTTTGTSLTDFDQNQDGYLDAVWLVYANNYSTASDSIYWAYTYWDYQQTGNVSSPVANVYAWASYNFMWEGGYSVSGTPKVDAHTYIHETGHVLGLDDYYTYDEGDWGAAGGVDMMDYNIVDHNAYSKMALGWTLPYVTDKTAGQFSITLNPFESSGDCLILKNNWNGSVLDEYLLIEFYTPTGVNESDSQSGGYPGNGLAGFSLPGIKIYHIDSRMGTFNASYEFVNFTDTLVNNASYYTDLAVSNTASYSYANENYKLVHLLEAGKTNTFKNGGSATDSTLFFAGKTFSPSAYANFFYNSGKFNDNSSIGYSVYVDTISATSATLTITQVA